MVRSAWLSILYLLFLSRWLPSALGWLLIGGAVAYGVTRERWVLLAIVGAFLYAGVGRYLSILMSASLAYPKYKGRRAVLALHPRISREVKADVLIEQTERAESHVEQLMGKLWMRPLVVIPDHGWTVYDGFIHLGGIALPATAVIGATTACAYPERFEEMVRHELAHLRMLSRSWLRGTPAYVVEGVASLVAEGFYNCHIDYHAVAIMKEGDTTIPAFLDDRAFYTPSSTFRNYMLAGSFMGFLVRTCGWEATLRFVRLVDARNHVAAFQKAYGMSVTEADRLWREELQTNVQSIPDLPRLQTYWRVWLSLAASRLDDAAFHAEEYKREYGAELGILQIAAQTHFMLGEWEKCRQHWRDILVIFPNIEHIIGSYAWLHIAFCSDLLQQREEAVQAYRNALTARAMRTTYGRTTHQLARRHVSHPFTRAEHAEFVRLQYQRLYCSDIRRG